MKIFNWVHRKLYQKDGLVGRNLKKDEVMMNNEIICDSRALLEDASFAHMFLTIGTFGFDPLKDVQYPSDTESEDGDETSEDEYNSVENEECEITVTNYDKEDEELNPLMYAAFANEQNVIMAIDGTSLCARTESEYEVSNKKLKKERITLADLFSADSDDQQKTESNSGKIEPELQAKKPSPHVKSGLSFAKKLIPKVREDSRPIQKLHQLMTRVLKRKVHPDIESKIQKNNSQVKAAASVLGLSCGDHGTIECVSLLKTHQDITA